MIRHLRHRYLLLLAILVLLLAGYSLRRPVMGMVRDWRLEANLSKAERALADEDFRQAQQFLGAAWRMHTDNLELLGRMMVLAEKFWSPDLPAIALARFLHPDASIEDQAAVLELGLRQGDLVVVGDLYGKLSEARRTAPRLRLCHADFLERSGQTLEALEVVRELAKTGEEASAAKLRLTRLLPRLEGNPLARQEARSLVQEMVSAGDPNALAAFRNLSLLPAGERAIEAGPDLQSWLDHQPEAGLADRLLATELELEAPGAKGEEREEVIGRVVDQYAGEHPEEIALWLLRLDEREQILKLPPEALRSDDTLYTAYLQVLIDQERYGEAREWLENPHPKLDAVLLESLRAGLALKEGDEPRRVEFWQSAMEKARFTNRYGSFLGMLGIAERFGDGEMAAKVCRTIAQLPPRLLPDPRELGFLDLALGDDPAFLAQMHQRIEATRPDDPLAKFNRALIQFLRGEEIESATAALEDLSRRFPRALAFQCGQALVFLGGGEGAQALQLLKAQQADWEKLASDFEKAVYALVLRDQGWDREARALEGSINAARLPLYQREWLVAKGLGKNP